MQKRDYKMDNIRFLLIFLVLLGHFMELFSGELTLNIYKIIYSFHMPAFLFLTGFFARFDRQKIVCNLIYPYLLFQILYRAFDALILKEQDSFTITFGTPYWLLWYLLVTICYYLLLPFFDTKKGTSRILIIGTSLLVSILSGFDTSLGYYGSLARFFNFLPFFLAGYYASHTEKKHKAQLLLLIPVGLLLIQACSYILSSDAITKNVLYASYSYAKAGHTPMIRAMLLLTGFLWIALLLFVIPGKKIPCLSVLGQNTFPIFLFHGFVVRLVKKYNLLCYSELKNLLLAVLLSVLLICLLGNPWSAKVFHALFIPTKKRA